MGEQRVSLLSDKKSMHKFVKHLLRDVDALEYMIDNDWFETGITRIGAEQEMCMIDGKTFRPSCIAMKVIEDMKKDGKDWVETELARFNLEIGATPLEFKGKALSQMEKEIREKLEGIREYVEKYDSHIILTGILPTLQKFDMTMDNLTPVPRYFALMEAINKQLKRTAYELRLQGVDELLISHDSPLLEACNTSFQVHLQVDPKDFVKMYNLSLALTGPVMSMSANSPLVFGKRLWHCSRIALFQQSLDTRTLHDHLRERSPRVSFGNDWLHKSILEIYKEDIARFRVLIAGDVEEDSFKCIKDGVTPKLRALQVHNSTVYRWNRPCYGVSPNGKPHLRIENRVIGAGPTLVDEMANAAFWLGLMQGMAKNYDDIREHISFEDVRDNFGKAAKYGIDTKFTWLNDKKITAADLVGKELIPIAREGLKSMKIAKGDIDKYLDIVAGRVEEHMTGARWSLRAFSRLKKNATVNETLTTMTAAILENQKKGVPVHTWELPELSMLKDYRPSKLRVEEFMERDLFTVQPDDIIEMVADMMEWRKIRYMPVENEDGNFVGLVSSRLLLRHFTKQLKGSLNNKKATAVKDIMITDPTTVKPETTLVDALQIMKENKIGSLPVVNDKNELMGIITETQFLKITGRLMRRMEE